MPPRARTPKTPAEDRPPARHAKADGPICPEHWPTGWPRDDVVTASCQHGTWAR